MKDKKTKGIHISCDGCKIGIGPNYLNKEYIDVGPYKLCLFCNNLLKKNGFIYFNMNGELFKILLPDGSEKFISRKEFEELLS